MITTTAALQKGVV
jgi:peptidoglycan glycosyltransferase